MVRVRSLFIGFCVIYGTDADTIPIVLVLVLVLALEDAPRPGRFVLILI